MIKAILFDFDGTIVDSYPNTIDYFKKTVKHFGYQDLDDTVFDTLRGLNTYDMWQNIFPDFSEEKIQELTTFGHNLSLHTITEITLFPGVISVLNTLKSDYLLGIVTSRGKRSTTILLQHHVLLNYFSCIINREETKIHKPNPEGLLLAMDKLKVLPQQTVYVGDTETDILTAHNEGVVPILIEKSLGSYGTDYHITNITQLPAVINKL